ncbi:MAG: ROK family protein [Phycisphaerales bacterium]|nr:ROK family protein [Phycisphaerales bacterium]
MVRALHTLSRDSRLQLPVICVASMAKNRKKSGLVVGVDLGGTNITVGVVGRDHKIIATAKRKTKAALGLDGVIERIAETIGRACDSASVTIDKIDSVGIGAPSAIDFDDGVVINAGNLGWKQVPLRAILEKRLGKPVVIENDVNAAVWGEARLGAAKNWQEVLAVWVGTGIGGGLILNGALHRGTFHTAGEIGQMQLFPRGGMGRRTLEEYCGRLSLVRAMEAIAGFYPQSKIRPALAQRGDDGMIGSSAIAECYAAGDELVVRVVDDSAELLGIAIANAVTLLSVEAVVLGGGVVEALGKRYVARVRESFEWNVFPSTLKKCHVVASELGDSAGVLGVALLARG